MTDDIDGWCEAAEILNTRYDDYEETSQLADILPDGYRAIEVSNGDGYAVERQTTHAPKWIPVARFTTDNAKYEWADEIHKETNGEYRCIVSHTDGEVYLEARIDD